MYLHFNNNIKKTIDFVTENQLYNTALWEKITNVFYSQPDSEDGGWRGEYFGKTMRGACLIYSYTKDEKLYGILLNACKKVMRSQEKNGRISSYKQDKEFFGWDIWSRKYVLTGLFHFYHVSKDESFKQEILSCCKKHLDYIINKLENDNISIFSTSNAWGGINSCSILEPVVEAYKLIGDQRYLYFAKQLIDLGGVENGNLLQLALDNKLMPYQYPVKKAYETTSYFEGILAYYEVTKEPIYLQAVENYALSVAKSDLTVIGCAGCDCECFNNASVQQTENIIPYIMQETCVTVTWMRFCFRLLSVTQKPEYFNYIEQSTLNALYGALNENLNKQYCQEKDVFLDGMVFDSYSPLVNDSRGRGIGGYKEFGDDFYFGCCGAIGSAGFGIVPLSTVVKYRDGVLFNSYYNGSVILENGLRFDILDNYPVTDNVTINVTSSINIKASIYFKVPCWCDGFSLKINGNECTAINGVIKIDKIWSSGDIITVFAPKKLKSLKVNGKTAYTYGPFVLGFNISKDRFKMIIPDETYSVSEEGVEYKLLPPDKNENISLIVNHANKALRFSDYSSCGKQDYSDIITVWLS